MASVYWQVLIPHKDDVKIESMVAFRDYLVIFQRINGLQVYPFATATFGRPVLVTCLCLTVREDVAVDCNCTWTSCQHIHTQPMSCLTG